MSIFTIIKHWEAYRYDESNAYWSDTAKRLTDHVHKDNAHLLRLYVNTQQ